MGKRPGRIFQTDLQSSFTYSGSPSMTLDSLVNFFQLLNTGFNLPCGIWKTMRNPLLNKTDERADRGRGPKSYKRMKFVDKTEY